MSSEPIASSSAPRPLVSVSLAASKMGRTAGKAHKEQKTAVRRSTLSESVKTPFQKRKEQEAARQAVKDQEKAMKAEKEEEQDRKRTAIRERRGKQAEKEKLEQMKAKISLKKLQRMKKKQGRSKKING